MRIVPPTEKACPFAVRNCKANLCMAWLVAGGREGCSLLATVHSKEVPVAPVTPETPIKSSGTDVTQSNPSSGA